MTKWFQVIVIAASASSPLGVLAQGTPPPGPAAPVEKAEAEKPAPIAEVKCTLADPNGYSASLDKDGKQPFFDMSVGHCRYRTSDTGVSTLSAQITLDLNEDADVQRCQSFLVYFLFEVTTDRAGFGWPPYRTEIKEAVVTSVSGREQNLKLFLLHNQPATAPLPLRNLLSPADKPPTFDDIYWGEIELFSESPVGAFPRELASKLPQFGQAGDTPDYSVTLTVKTFPPRGLCFFQSSAAVTAKTETAPLTFIKKP